MHISSLSSSRGVRFGIFFHVHYSDLSDQIRLLQGLKYAVCFSF